MTLLLPQMITRRGPPSGPYAANGVNFDGSNDYLTRGADLTGSVDSKLFSGSFWIKRGSISFWQWVYRVDGVRTGITTAFGSKYSIIGRNVSGDTILHFQTSALDSEWHHIMWSVDLADFDKRHLYVDDVSDLTVDTAINQLIDFTRVNHAIGAQPDGTEKLTACLADVWIAPDQYIDLSVTANRRKFIDASGNPVDLGSNGAVPTGIIPRMFFSGATAGWETNLGGGGGFTKIGALTDCASDP